MTGVYHFCGEAHLHRYLAEFDFRHNNRSALGIEDTERAAKAVKGAEGKRLTYRHNLVRPITLKQKARGFIYRRRKRLIGQKDSP